MIMSMGVSMVPKYCTKNIFLNGWKTS